MWCASGHRVEAVFSRWSLGVASAPWYLSCVLDSNTDCTTTCVASQNDASGRRSLSDGAPSHGRSSGRPTGRCYVYDDRLSRSHCGSRRSVALDAEWSRVVRRAIETQSAAAALRLTTEGDQASQWRPTRTDLHTRPPSLPQLDSIARAN